MKRKVILHGPSTLTVSLPSKWVKANDVKKGDELDVTLFGDFIKVSTGKINYKSEFCIDFTPLSKKNIFRILACLHKNGYNSLNIKCKPRQIQTIQKRINSMLIGYEIVEVTPNGCIVKTISLESDLDFDNLFRRIFFVNLGLSRNLLEALEKKKFSSFDDILVLEETNNKLTNYIQRQINQRISSRKKLTSLYLISWVQEKTADSYRDVAILIKKEKKFPSEFIGLFEKVHNLLELYYDLFYNFDINKLESFEKEKKEAKDLVLLGLQKSKIIYHVKLYSLLGNIIDSISFVVGPTLVYNY
jgi:phosphate uptake regulator